MKYTVYKLSPYRDEYLDFPGHWRAVTADHKFDSGGETKQEAVGSLHSKVSASVKLKKE